MEKTKNRDFLKANNVLIATNGSFVPGSMLLNSINFYQDLIDENFIVVPAKNHINDVRPVCYGLQCFIELIVYAIKYNYDYILYIDEDCFITSEDNLISLFKTFVDGGYILGGTSDGGVVQPRNFNSISINPFLSFFNVKNLKKHIGDDYNKFIETLNNFNVAAAKFDNTNVNFNLSRENRETCKKFTNKQEKSVLRLNPNASVFHQEGKYFGSVYEPYYRLFLWIATLENEKIFYFNTSDYYSEADKTGITSVVYNGDFKKKNIVCLHTWYSRVLAIDNIWHYTKDAVGQNERIKGVYEEAVKMSKKG